MIFKTKKQMLDGVLNELALVTGSSVQTYSEPIIFENIETCFFHLAQKRFWDHLTSTTIHTLDGADGVVTDTLLGINDSSDIKWIKCHPYNEGNIINYSVDGLYDPLTRSDYIFTYLPYTHQHYNAKIFQFYPKDLSIDIAIRARRIPQSFEQDDDIIPFDAIAMKHFVTASMLAIDGMNPSSENRQNILFEDRYETIIANEANHIISLGSSKRFSSEFTVAK